MGLWEAGSHATVNMCEKGRVQAGHCSTRQEGVPGTGGGHVHPAGCFLCPVFLWATKRMFNFCKETCFLLQGSGFGGQEPGSEFLMPLELLVSPNKTDWVPCPQ